MRKYTNSQGIVLVMEDSRQVAQSLQKTLPLWGEFSRLKETKDNQVQVLEICLILCVCVCVVFFFLTKGCKRSSKESDCKAGDPSSIPGSRRSTGERMGYPLQHSWASLVGQLVKNPPAMWETWVQSLGWEDPLEKGKATHSSVLAWTIPWNVWSTESQRVGHD